MAGKSNKSKNKRATHNSNATSSEQTVAVASADATVQPKNEPTLVNSPDVVANGVATTSTDESSVVTKPEDAKANEMKQPEGDVRLYPVSVKTQNGEKLELQLNPGDSVIDLRQFLLDAPETCYFTCYELMLHTKDGSVHQLADYNEISEVADITTGGCSLEMIPALYDDRSIRAHVHRTRELFSLSAVHSSLSTSLALQHDTSRNTTAEVVKTDAVKTDVLELDGLGFMEDSTGLLSELVSSSSKEINCVESIIFSSFNPPPSHRRLVGDLIYIDVTTLEGNTYCITGTTTHFYVNSSTGNMLDPRPKFPSETTTLVGLLQKISPKFKKAFREVLELKASAHPFETVQSLLVPNSWLGAYPIPDHKRDAARAEDALTLSYGSELIGMQRDWNEELQSCREFPHTTHQERILRDRALYKVTSDFVNAAVSGAVGVINRCIPPINPTDPECFHMYVHNNIFFSFAIDADLGQLSKSHASTLEPKNSTSSCNAPEKDSSNLLHGAGAVLDAEKSDGSSTDEVQKQDVIPDVRADSQLADNEQATYASANNDLKGTKAYQEADVQGLYNLAMAIIDYRGHRVVAQSIIPGILQGDKSDSLLYGSVDNGKKICWNEAFHSKVIEAAKHLHLKEHAVLDGSGNVVKLAAPVECKGIVGSDDRHYLLDLMRATPRDANYTGGQSRFCVLRPELVSAFCEAEATERIKSKSKSEKTLVESNSSNVTAIPEVSAEATAVGSNSEDTTEGEKVTAAPEVDSVHVENGAVAVEILLNPNVLTEFTLSGSQAEIDADEECVRKAGDYLKDVVLPKFVQDLCTLEVSPMDGQTLTEALHAHGINVRYMGKIADMTKHLPHIWDLCAVEIVVRSAKHILKDVLRDSQDHDIANTIAHFLNCFFGHIQPLNAKGATNNSQSRSQKKDQAGHQVSGKSSKTQARSKSVAAGRTTQASYKQLATDSLWSNIDEFAKLKYQFELTEDARPHVKKVSAIRNLCSKVGITIAARKYDLDSATPFQTSDILNLQPVVKHSVPVCSEARNLVETGKVRLAEGMLNEAYTLFSEAFSILQQVTGPMHREVANCCRYLAMVLYHAGDMAGAIMQQHKELIINERCLGLDHPDTAHSYGNMALFYHGLNQTELALRHMSRTLLLLGLSCGPDHPDVAATFINVAMMYQDINKMDTALRYLQEALKKNERLLGEEHIQTAVCYHALAIAWNCMGNYKLSLQHETKTYDILVKQLGEEDSRTRDSQNWIKTFKMRGLQANAQKQKGQAVDAVATRKALDMLKTRPDLMQMIQMVGASANKSEAAVGGNVQRGARATAEAKKKVAAKGVVRPGAQALESDVANSGTSPETRSNGLSEESNVNEQGNVKENGSVVLEDQAPVGLGTSLTKKQKKPKNT